MYLSKIIRVFGIVDYISVFSLGLSMGLYREKKISKLLYLVVIILSFQSFYLYKGLPQSIFFIINYLLLQYLVSNENCFLNKNSIITKPVTWIAALSYPLYLIHQKIGYIIISNTITLTGYSGFAVIILPILVSVAVAYYLHRYVECNSSIRIFEMDKI